MSDTAVRYLTMLRMVPREPRSITTRELARRLEDRKFPVTMRSIQRDLEKLSAYFPLQVDESSRPFRWSFDREATIDLIPALEGPSGLTLEMTRQYLSPVLSSSTVSHLGNQSVETHRPVIRGNSPFRQWLERVRIIDWEASGGRPDVPPAVMEAVTEALITECKCRLTTYSSQKNQVARSTVNALGLIFKGTNVFLVCTIDGRGEVQNLALNSASQAMLIEERTEIPDGFDLDLHIHSGAMATLKSEEPVYLHLYCDKPALNQLQKSPLGPDQVTQNVDDDGFGIKVTVGDTQELRWWLAARAIHCDVLEPLWLREEIRAALENSLERIRRQNGD